MCIFIFFNDTATTEIYTLSLHDALPISPFSMYQYDGSYAVEVQKAHPGRFAIIKPVNPEDPAVADVIAEWKDRKSTRLNSSHANISYAVFCLKQKHTTELIQEGPSAHIR